MATTAQYIASDIRVWHDEGMAQSGVSIWGFQNRHFNTEDEAYEFARQAHAAKLLAHFFDCLAPYDIAMQSACRGPVPYANRDYSQWYPAGGLEQIIPPTTLEVLVAARQTLRDRLATVKPEDVHKLPLDERREWTAMRLETWSFSNRLAHEQSPVSLSIMPATADLTPRQIMAKAITRAIASIPQSWGDHDKIKLPYGFYLQRKGFDEARIYHPKHRGSIPAGFLGKGWQVNPSHMLRNSLDTIESIIKRHKLDKPSPEPTEPASQPAKAAA